MQNQQVSSTALNSESQCDVGQPAPPSCACLCTDLHSACAAWVPPHGSRLSLGASRPMYDSIRTQERQNLSCSILQIRILIEPVLIMCNLRSINYGPGDRKRIYIFIRTYISLQLQKGTSGMIDNIFRWSDVSSTGRVLADKCWRHLNHHLHTQKILVMV